LTRLLLRNAAVVSALTAACALPLCFFAQDFLAAWTRDPVVAGQGARILALYTLGGIAIANASVFYSMQMALGSVQYAAVFNTIALLWYPLVMGVLIRHLGAVGAAWCWLAYGVAAWAAVFAISFARHLEREAMPAYFRRIVPGLALATAVSALAHRASGYFPDVPAWLRLPWAIPAAALILPGSLLAGLGREAGREWIYKLLRRPA
jgi:O-antigen/teichoic acid export membrane protein